ncbi:MAG: two-component regulator propeller domain-containing protein [Verrucomicrobiae bacterium]|nr:two-component regulator propeller domain-containing protein [Verrucomicrobiae bacterium]
MKSPARHRLCRPPACGWLALACVVVLAASPVRALEPADLSGDFIAAHWDTEDGLPHNLIRCIFQTRDGYLWIGTQQGLARFDGLAFTVFNRHNTPALQNNIITSFAETRDGSLWIGTSLGLTRYHDGQFTTYGRTNGLKADTINSLCVTPDGALWIGGRDGITRWIDGKFVNDIDTSAFPMTGLRSFGVDRHGAVWFAVGFEALCYRDGKFTHFGRAEGLPAQSLHLLREDMDGNIMAATYDGVWRLKDGQFVPFQWNDALSSRHVDATLNDHAGNLWIGSMGGLDRSSIGGMIPCTDSNGDKLGVVDALFEDREHCIWVGSSTGLFRLTPRRASMLPLQDKTAETLVTTLIQSRDAALWIGKYGKGVDRILNGVTTHYTVGAPLSRDQVTAIYQAPDGTVWVGNRGSAVDRLDGDKATTFIYQSGVVSSRPVTTIYEDSSGALLVGISRRGLLQLSEGKLTPAPGAGAFVGDTVWTFKQTHDGRLLMGTDKGLYQRNADHTWKHVALGGTNNFIGARAILEADDGALWIATEGNGLVRWQHGQERAYTSREGMVDDVLFSVLDDNRGSFWVNSARGIARIRKTEFIELDRGTIASLNCLTFGRADGLLSASTSGNGNSSAVCLADGSILAATDKGVAVIDQRRVQINVQPPPVVIESIVVDDRPLPHIHEVSVPPGAYRLEIHYSALSLVAPERLRFRYQLEGSDPGWIEAGHQRTASYTRLAPGHYVFRVLACNNDGVWNETGASLALQIQPHFYQTKAFIALAVTAALAAALAIYQVRRKVARRRMTMLEGLVDARTSELKSAKESAESAVCAKNEFIQALKQAEVEREALYKQLLETSRQAGMAEVASNVLHNVGNVLNSVNVSAAIVGELARKSRVAQLGKAVALLDEHAGNLADFIAHDPKGIQLRAYLHELSKHLNQEQQTSLKELDSLRRNIEHINDIVTMQQGYARVSGLTEVVRVKDLVEYSLRMDTGSLQQNQVRLVRDFHAVPAITVEKHKVLQILVNLLRNAKHACADSGRADKQVTLSITNGGNHVRISVADNGVGIPPENLPRIFHHGFTTRKSGHGFGLHSGALSAKDLGGALIVHSDGLGCGAVFTLELPLQPPTTDL